MPFNVGYLGAAAEELAEVAEKSSLTAATGVVLYTGESLLLVSAHMPFVVKCYAMNGRRK
ncbi:hypothetical protein ACOMH0_19310 [Bacillus sp. YIM B13601]|uniref:hypothetical protein n=1 Tax=Bacillus sp. YIM B13601 TaxID=3366869 RepID=UPI003B824183